MFEKKRIDPPSHIDNVNRIFSIGAKKYVIVCQWRNKLKLQTIEQNLILQ